MTGKTSGAIAKIKEKTKGCSSSHCILHRHALAMKKMQPFIKEVLAETVKIINFINLDLTGCSNGESAYVFTSSHRNKVALP
ncbi:hypothetical protein AVEN_213079-1, partial [Araneus ventricosus]